eukprot:CAMPEP_0180072932 /NCGR_PEP_ID=MMETSP0985-20121206/12993_1 /TAXON_ID=483367 /ORGANISM="non described non described, Strain CCMP 2436" /LENGTH=91 /DNA_ID=CAMNT_0022004363 /DNA_START=107 /DNA_END=382 /DNA_ORIENTATION=+
MPTSLLNPRQRFCEPPSHAFPKRLPVELQADVCRCALKCLNRRVESGSQVHCSRVHAVHRSEARDGAPGEAVDQDQPYHKLWIRVSHRFEP